MGSVINSNKISRRKSYFSIKKIAFSIQTKFYLKSSNKKPKFNSIQKHLNMFGKIATLSAIGAATAWDLSLSSNTTWAANDAGDQAGGIFFFDNVGGSWYNGTGSCTVSAGDGINFINGHCLFPNIRAATLGNSSTSEMLMLLKSVSPSSPTTPKPLPKTSSPSLATTLLLFPTVT